MLAVQARTPAGLVPRLRQVFEREVIRWRGQIVNHAGDPLLAVFDGPGRAVQCGTAVIGEARRGALAAAAGVRIGEVDPRERSGPVFDVAEALARSSDACDVRVSQTVVDLVPGSGLRFQARGHLTAGPLDRPVPVLTVA